MSPSTPSARLSAISSQVSANSSVGDTPSSLPPIRSYGPTANTPRVASKVVIITGANSPLGIGRAAAHQYAAHGCTALYICDFDASNLPAIKAEISSLYPTIEVHVRQFDAADESAIKEVVDHAVKTYGRLDVFFANAGITGPHALFTDIESKDFMDVFRTNTLGPFLACKYAAPAMKITGKDKPASAGSIILTASVAGLRSNAGSTPYSASKAAVVSLAQTVAYQLTGSNIRVNALCPGLIETGMTKLVFESARQRGTEKKIGQLNPMKRGGVADEIARVALFLGSDDSSYVNGQAWAVDGGLSAGHPHVPGKLA